VRKILPVVLLLLAGCGRKFMVKKSDLKPPRVTIRQSLNFKTGVQVCKVGVMRRVWREVDCKEASEESGVGFNQNLVRPDLRYGDD